MKSLRLLMVVGLLVAGAACTGDSKVGEGLEGDSKNDEQVALRTSPSPTPEPAKGTPAPTAAPTRPPVVTPQPATRQQPSVEFIIDISGYNPYYIRVYVNGVVKVVNKDNQARSVTATKGEFDSGLIPPNGEWFYTATTVGKFEFKDSTRPYVLGTLEVLAR